jgi:L-aminopeptidase/D-esterase-like protein
MDLANSAAQLKRGSRGGVRGENTTLVVVATNARLTKVSATKLAQSANIGTARALSPPFTMLDGDVAIALSLGSAAADMNALGVAAAEAVAQAIARAVQFARTLGGVPGLGGRA